ncbi:F0F1 ATP synthase subunit B family protein [Gluconobacter morbifer]|uniref:ATP synthase subunit b n=1 Tax=Gluconobacter morbifer G707 TaxID=1088869 RepID=G6XKJ0_9PROT|nr:ATP synthase subunit B' [Gluconobacter morbifer]EHH67786.1 ATP synthase B' chain [Gluconobacter morbifer G707]
MHRTPRLFLFAAPLAAVPVQALAAGMPQLNVHDPLLIGQVVWGAVIFAGFYLVVSRSALPRIERVLSDRRTRIQNDLDIARRAKAEADKATADLVRARHEAAAQARANIERIQNEARTNAEAHAAATAKRLESEIASAENQIAQSREQALSSVPQIATGTAQALVTRLLGTQQDEQTVASAVERASA